MVKPKRKFLTPLEIEKAKALYRDGIPAHKIGSRFQVTGECIFYHLRKEQGLVRKSKQFSCNEHYFDDLSSEGPAYWFGFLIADGSIATNRPQLLKLSLATIDKERLEQFKRVTNFSGNIYSFKNGAQFSIEISCAQWAAKLKEYGWKSAAAIDVIPEQTFHHFVRGFLDGDGSISPSIPPRGNIRWNVSWAGPLDFLSALRKKILVLCGVDLFIAVSGSAFVHQLACQKQSDVARLLKWLYTDANTFMHRKQHRAQEAYAAIQVKQLIKSDPLAYQMCRL